MSCLESNSLFHLASGVWSVASAWFQFCCQWERESLSHSHLSQKTKYIKSEQFLLYFECELSTWGGNPPEGFTLKAKQSKISCSPLMVCVWLQGGGSVRGMTVPSAVPQPLPPVISAHAPFAGITRKEPSPPLHLKAVSAAPVTTLPVPWAPIPALPSHTAPPRAPSEWKKSQRRRQGRPWRLPTDSAAQLNTSFPVKCTTVGLQATSGLKQCAMEGNTVLYDQCCGPHAKKRHTDEHLSAVCGTTSVLTGEVSRHHWHCSSYFFLGHETLPVQLSGARLVEPQTHSVVFFCHFSKLEKSSVLSSTYTGTLEKQQGEVEKAKTGRRGKVKAFHLLHHRAAPLLVYLL